MIKIVKRFLFPVTGLLSFFWILFRLLPKPSRAAYPCMKVATPIASSFVIWLVGIFTSVLFFKKAKKFLYHSRYLLSAFTILLGITFAVISHVQTNKKLYAAYRSKLEGPNVPMGQGVGLNPGRVVWIYEPDATNENCRNRSDDYWWMDKNTNQEVVKKMLSDALKKLTDKSTDAEAWEAIFRNHNQSRGRGEGGYKAGEKIVIKINLNAGVQGEVYTRPSRDLGNIDTSPQIVYAVLDQLVNTVGAPQADIGFGDPGRTVDDLFWDRCHADFPDVEYWGDGNGRTEIKRSSQKVIFTSNGQMSDWLPTCYLEADYMINIPVLKKHHRAGISLSSKNHFGSFVRFNNGANHWHFSLPCSEGGAEVTDGEYGMYRCFVDFMGHTHIGRKTILYLIDGIWGSTNWAHPPIKWRMEPFNDDWPSSIFLSQDPVAIESVGFDFLREEFDEDHPTEGAYDRSDNRGPFPQYPAVDDFLHQAADAANWPVGITYDPENDGTRIPLSLGAHEHWNNPIDKQYSRNLGLDTGIELVSNAATEIDGKGGDTVLNGINFALDQNYPNPFNASTTIGLNLAAPSHVILRVYNVRGQALRTIVDAYQEAGQQTYRWDGSTDSGQTAPSGIYVYQVVASFDGQTLEQTKKMILSK